MKNSILLVLSLFLGITIINGQNCAIDVNENFSSYSTGSGFVSKVRASGDNCWTLFDGNNVNGAIRDAPILSSNGNNFLRIDYDSRNSTNLQDDIVRLLGNKTTGRYTISFDMKVYSGFTGYYGVLHNFIPNSTTSDESWAYEVFFDDCILYVKLGGNSTRYSIISYPHNQWFNISQVIDIDNNRVDFYYNGRRYAYWSFSAASSGYNSQLSALNFFAWKGAGYDIDNVTISGFGSGGGGSNYCRLVPDKTVLSETGDDLFLSIFSNSDWCLKQNWPSWIFPTGNIDGNGDDMILFGVSPNNSTNPRSYTIELCCGTLNCSSGNCNSSEQVTITQLGNTSGGGYCEFDPSTIAVGIKGGIQSTGIKVNNSTYTFDSYFPQDMFNGTPSPSSGSQSPITFTVNNNQGNPPRTGTITYLCNSTGQKFSLTINQAGEQPGGLYFEFDPSQLYFPPEGGQQDIEIVTNASGFNQTGSDAFDWVNGVPETADGNDNGTIVTISVDTNYSFNQREAIYKYSFGGTQPYEFRIYQEAATISRGNPPWEVDTTSLQHIIYIPDNLQTDLVKGPLEQGDWIGFFFTDNNGNEKCGGAAFWDGNETFATVYGDEPFTNDKDGFANREEFRVKIWRRADSSETTVEAQYFVKGSGRYNAEEEFIANGISGIFFLTSKNCLNIDIYEGRRIISSYIKPGDPSIQEIFKDVRSLVDVVLDKDGNAYFPWNGINSIGDWTYNEAYQVGADKSFEIIDKFCGEKVVPEDETITFGTSFTIIPYLRDSRMKAHDQFGPIQNDIEIIRDYSYLNVYYPKLGLIDQLELIPTEGYFIKGKTQGSFQYQPNFKSEKLETRGRGEIKDDFGVFWPTKPINNGIGANFIISKDVLSQFGLEEGDELAVFNSNDEMLGSRKYINEHLVIPIQGDDPTSKEIIEGFIDGENIYLKLYKNKTGEILNLDYKVKDFDCPVSFTEKMYWEIIDIDESQDSHYYTEAVSIYPNPSNGRLNVLIPGDWKDENYTITISNSIGKKIHEMNVKGKLISIDLSNLASNGLYLLHIYNNDGKLLTAQKVFVN